MSDEKKSETSEPTAQTTETQPQAATQQQLPAEMSPEEKERADVDARLAAKLEDPQYLAERDTYEAQVRASLKTTGYNGPGYSRPITKPERGGRVDRSSKPADYHGSNHRDR